MDKAKAFEILSKRIDEWESKSKTDAYEYEKSFIEVMQKLNEELLQLSIGEVSIDRNKKKLQTRLGEIEVSKGHILEPKSSFRQSPFLQETALYLGQNQTFNESSLLLKKLCGIDLSDKQTENLCHHYGEKIEVTLTDNESVTSEKKEDLHYVMVDGSYILSREENWIETKVGRVFKGCDNFAISEKRSVIKESEYIVHIGTHTDFIAKFSPILNKLNNIVFIADGAPWTVRFL